MSAPAASRPLDPLVDIPTLDPAFMMNPDHVLPAVAKVLQARYEARFRQRRAEIGLPLPKRPRRHKFRPAPGILDAAEIEG